MTRKIHFLAIAVCIASVASGAAFAADAEPKDMDPTMLAKLAKAKAKAASSSSSKTNGKDGCDVNIGNQIGQQRGSVPQDIIVVVQGDVINTNNKCR